MALLTIQIDDKNLDEMRAEADRIGITVDQYVRTTLMRSLALAEAQRTSIDRETFVRAMACTLKKNDELYDRLAQK